MIHGWIALAARVGFVPVPLAAQDGRTVQAEAGRLWEVAPWRPGRPPDLPEPRAPEVRSGFAALGAMHQALRVARAWGQSPGLRERIHEVEWWLATGFSTLEARLRGAGDAPSQPAREWLALARRTGPEWLATLRGAAALSVWCQPCLRDARPEHLLFEHGHVSGLVDFGAMGIDTVAADLARHSAERRARSAEWLGADRLARAEALASYSAVRPLDETETTLIRAFETSASLLAAGHWARWHYLDERPFRDPEAVTRGLQKGLDRLALRVALDE
jgi:homoserine kinase type II